MKADQVKDESLLFKSKGSFEPPSLERKGNIELKDFLILSISISLYDKSTVQQKVKCMGSGDDLYQIPTLLLTVMMSCVILGNGT